MSETHVWTPITPYIVLSSIRNITAQSLCSRSHVNFSSIVGSYVHYDYGRLNNDDASVISRDIYGFQQTTMDQTLFCCTLCLGPCGVKVRVYQRAFHTINFYYFRKFSDMSHWPYFTSLQHSFLCVFTFWFFVATLRYMSSLLQERGEQFNQC